MHFIDVKIADDDLADILAGVADVPHEVALEPLEHLVILLAEEVRDGHAVRQVRRVALHLVVHDHDVLQATPAQKDG